MDFALSVYSQDILIILTTTLCFAILLCLAWVCCCITQQIRNQDLTISLDQSGKQGKLRRTGNNYHITISQPRPLPTPYPSQTLYENSTNREPSAPLPLPASSTPPVSESEREEEESFIQASSVDERSEREDHRIKHLQAALEVLIDRIGKIESQIRKLEK